MRRLILAAALVAGCGTQPAPRQYDGYRDPAVPIASSTRFDPARFAGGWTRLAAFAPPYDGPGCTAVSFEADGADAFLMRPCGGNGPAERLAIGPYGRLTPRDGPSLWVLWVDEDHRTAVVGTPDGSLGWILNRGPTIRPDRMRAAREVLAFNGYDLARLKEVGG